MRGTREGDFCLLLGSANFVTEWIASCRIAFAPLGFFAQGVTNES